MKSQAVFNAGLMGEIRNRFENVESDPIAGKRIYFENAGGTLRLKSVLKAVNFFTGLPDNAGRRNQTSRKITDTIIKGREDVRLLLGAPAAGHVISEQSGTGMIFRVISTVARSVPGGNLVTSNLEHPAVYDACHILARRHGLDCRVATLDRQTGSVPVEAVTRLVDKDTVMLAIIHASNILGSVNDVGRMAAEARRIKPDLYIIVDGCQYGSHGVIDVAQYGADAWIFDAYKIYSKIGTNFACLTSRLASLDRDNLLGKATTDWDLGTREPAAFASISCVAEYLQWLGSHFSDSRNPREIILAAMRAVESHEHQITELMLHGAEGIPGLCNMKHATVYGAKDDLNKYQAIIAFNLKGIHSADIVDYLEANGVRVHNRTSDAYSRHVLAALGIKECVRVSLGHYNTAEEVLMFLQKLQAFQ